VRTKLFPAVFLLVVIFIISCARSSFDKTVVLLKGDRVTLKEGGHMIVGTLGESGTTELLFKDEGRTVGTFHGDAFVTTMDKVNADVLKAEYGDFFTCGAPGVQSAVQNMKPCIFVASNDEIRRRIQTIMIEVRKNTVPVVHITFAPIKIESYQWNGMNVNDTAGIQIVYVTEVTMLSATYF